MTRPYARFSVKINKRTETLETAANDGDHQWKAKCASPNEGFRCAANANP